MFNNPQYIGPIAEQGVPQAGLAGKVQGMISAPTGPVAYLPVQQPTYSPQQLQDMRQKYVLPPNLNLEGSRQIVLDRSRIPTMSQDQRDAMATRDEGLNWNNNQMRGLLHRYAGYAQDPQTDPHTKRKLWDLMIGSSAPLYRVPQYPMPTRPTTIPMGDRGAEAWPWPYPSPPVYPARAWDNLYAGGSAQLMPSVGATRLATPLQPGVR